MDCRLKIIGLVCLFTTLIASSVVASSCETANQVWASVTGYGQTDPNPSSNTCVQNCINQNPTNANSGLQLCLNVNCRDGFTELSTTAAYNAFMAAYKKNLANCQKQQFAPLSSVQKILYQQLRQRKDFQTCIVPYFKSLPGYVQGFKTTFDSLSTPAKFQASAANMAFLAGINDCFIKVGFTFPPFTVGGIVDELNASPTTIFDFGICEASGGNGCCTISEMGKQGPC